MSLIKQPSSDRSQPVLCPYTCFVTQNATKYKMKEKIRLNLCVVRVYFVMQLSETAESAMTADKV
jgi:hypothetical protein